MQLLPSNREPLLPLDRDPLELVIGDSFEAVIGKLSDEAIVDMILLLDKILLLLPLTKDPLPSLGPLGLLDEELTSKRLKN